MVGDEGRLSLWVGLLCTLQQREGPLGKQDTGQLFAELLEEDSSLHYRVVRHATGQGRRQGEGLSCGWCGLVEGCGRYTGVSG